MHSLIMFLQIQSVSEIYLTKRISVCVCDNKDTVTPTYWKEIYFFIKAFEAAFIFLLHAVGTVTRRLAAFPFFKNPAGRLREAGTKTTKTTENTRTSSSSRSDFQTERGWGGGKHHHTFKLKTEKR